MAYIYKITNLINGKLYIGKTSNAIEERWKEHINDSRRARCEKRPLYDAFNKYGIENFQIEEIEQVENDEIACQREIYWIDKLRTYIGFDDCNGYNATLGGDSKRYYNYKELADSYLELGTLIAVARKFNCDRDTVKTACQENNIEIVSPNHKKYDYDMLVQSFLELQSCEKVAKKFRCSIMTVRRACAEKGVQINSNPKIRNHKKIRRISKNGEIKEYLSITEAANDLFNSSKNKTKLSTIITHLCGYGLKKKGFTYGYYWEYVE